MGILKKRGSALGLMRSKRKFSLLILLTLFLLMVPPASAHLEPEVNSFWATTIPTINGIIAAGEWTDAAVRDFTLYMRDRSTGALNQTLNATFYVKNNYGNIYAALQIFNEDYDAQNFIGGWDGFGLFFEENHDGILSTGDNGEGFDNYAGPPPAPWYANNDLYWNSTVNTWVADIGAGGANDGAMAWSHTDPVEDHLGNYTFEMRIPLVGSDGDALDFAISSLPKTLGFKIWFYERDEGIDGVYPDDPTISQNVLETKNGATFGNLILHPLYTLTITTTAGGTTNQTSGMTYGYGTVVNVLAIPSGGYVFDHWELDTVPVGSANPYSVTMNMNHTLHAVFRVIPPPAVGGIAAPIVIPINEPNLLAPLIWLVSAIICPIVLMTIFVKLKKKKL